MTPHYRHALIIGAGSGLSASLARLFHAKGLKVSLAARTTDKLGELASETEAGVFACDSGVHGQVVQLFESLDAGGAPDVVVYNPSARVRGPFIEIDPAARDDSPPSQHMEYLDASKCQSVKEMARTTQMYVVIVQLKCTASNALSDFT